VVEKMREPYNDYGSPNIAVFDFYSLLTVDLRPVITSNSSQKLARIAYVKFDKVEESWKIQQNTILGFIERGLQWDSRRD
jgi:hypothetical protein